jgi:LAS superfamily LD-carboxypeptidase LdcB
VVVACAALLGVLVHQAPGASSASAGASTVATAPSPPALQPPPTPLAATADDGEVPDGTTVYDHVAAVTRLDPALLGALRRAAAGAADDGVELEVNSGWRSPEHQQRLLEEAVAKYGSLAEAQRWVATPETSAHVSGDAVDIGPVRAASWLSRHGARYGLCEVYRNEPWHFELRPSAPQRGCPRPYADPTQDPRM